MSEENPEGFASDHPANENDEFWIPPATFEAAKAPERPIILTVGKAKIDVLLQAGALPIAFQKIAGVAEIDADDGGLYRLRSELLEFGWNRRAVYLAFDADWRAKPEDRAWAICAFMLLRIKGAEIYQLEWAGTEGVGIDEYLKRRRNGATPPEGNDAEALNLLVKNARHFLWTLDAPDLEAVVRLLQQIEMPEFWFSKLTKELAKQLKVKPRSLGTREYAVEEQDEDQDLFIDIPPTAEPWSEPVVVEEVLEEIGQTLSRFVWMQPYQTRAVSLWIVLTYLHDAVSLLPLLAITSPDEECGKTTLMELLLYLTNRPIPASNISTAAIYRTIKDDAPTLLLDEADTYMKEDEAMRGVINSGHKRAFAYVIRVINDDGDTGRLSTWCPKAIAMIGLPKPTILSRSIHIRLQRKDPKRKLEFLTDNHDKEFTELRAKIARLAKDIREKVREAPEVNLLGNRAGNNWRPLFAIAREGGETWLEDAIESAKGMQSKAAKDSGNFNRYLIASLGDLVRQTRQKQGKVKDAKFFLRTDEDILNGTDGLNNDKEAPWADLPNKLTARKLGQVLTEYEIESVRRDVEPDPKNAGTSDSGRKQARGYWSADLEKVARRYRKQKPESGQKGEK